MTTRREFIATLLAAPVAAMAMRGKNSRQPVAAPKTVPSSLVKTLEQCGRVVDLGGRALTLDDAIAHIYRMRRARLQSAEPHDTIDLILSPRLSHELDIAYRARYAAKYGPNAVALYSKQVRIPDLTDRPITIYDIADAGCQLAPFDLWQSGDDLWFPCWGDLSIGLDGVTLNHPERHLLIRNTGGIAP